MATTQFIGTSNPVTKEWAQDVNDTVYAGVTATGGAAVRPLEDRFGDRLSVLDFGADPTGAADSYAAFAAAITYVIANKKSLLVPAGSYLLNQKWLIPYGGYNGNKIHIHFDNAELFPGNNNQTIMHWADSHSYMTGVVTFTTNSKSGITCFKLMPELEALNTAVVNQNHNRFLCHMRFVGADEGLVVMTGIPYGGVSSGCYYNVFQSIFSTSTKRAIWFKDNGSVDSASSGPNSNIVYSFIVNGSTNTGLQIDAGGGQHFYSAQFENITLGTSPNATPVAIKIAQYMANGGAMPGSNFYSLHFENCTSRFECATPATKVFCNQSELVNSKGQLIPFVDYYNSVIAKKGELISAVMSIVSNANNIKGLWLYDEYGATSTIIDKSLQSHDMTLRTAALATQNATEWGPSIWGLAQGVTYCDQSHLADVANHADFNFGNSATDSAFSVVSLAYPLLTASTEILSKDDLTTGTTKRCWSFGLESSGQLTANCFDNSTGGVIGRVSSAGAVIANSWQLLTRTYSGSATSAGVKLYVNKTQVDNANSASGAYTAMESLTNAVGTYRVASGGTPERAHRGRKAFDMIVSEELTLAQIKRLHMALMAYVGQDI